MLVELTSYFGRIQDQLHALCEVITSNDMQNDLSMNDRNVACENELHFDENDTSNVSFNEEISISHDNTFGTNFESQDISINDSCFIPFEECVESIGSKGIVAQETLMASPLVSTQMINS